MNADAPHTVVELRIGTASFARCVADVFTKDTLTITGVDDEQPIAVFQPGEWRAAATYAPDGSPIYAHQSETPVRGIDFTLLKKTTSPAA